MSKNDAIYINHILDTIRDIETSIKGLSKEEFQNNKDISDACVRRLEIIGEAVKNISKGIKARYPKVEWRKIAGTRDMVIHSYFNVDLDIVLNIVKNEIPLLRRHILKIKEELLS